MLNQSPLWTELSEAQQELVAGGGELVNVKEFDYTDFEYQSLDLMKNIQSGPQGSSITKQVKTNFVDTAAFEALNLDFKDKLRNLPGNHSSYSY